MKYNIITFGCKVNQYESNMMKESLLHHNFCYEENIDDCDIIIVNTCTVTNTADKKCLKTIKSFINKYNNKILVVCGCSAQNKQELYKNLKIDILIGNKDKSKIAKIITNYLKDKNRFIKFYNNRDLEFENMVINNFNHVRAYIKIEDGCDNFCSYCIIPFVRGSVRCKDYDVILKEAKCLADNNHCEIVLTGIHTGRYNFNNLDLSDLLNDLWITVEPLSMITFNGTMYLGTSYELGFLEYVNWKAVNSAMGRVLPCAALTTGSIIQKYPDAPLRNEQKISSKCHLPAELRCRNCRSYDKRMRHLAW